MNDYQGCKAALAALEDAFAAVFAAAREGLTAEEIDAIMRERLRSRGAALIPARNSPFVVDPAGQGPKLRLDRRPLPRGKLWGIDNSACLNGYHADIGRYGFFGRPTPELLADYAAVAARADAIAREVRAGRGMREIYDSCPRDMPFEIHRIADQPAQPPYCGNSVPGVIEEMKRGQAAGLTYAAGQVICVEVWAGLRGGIEDMYLLEDDGLKMMNRLPRALNVIA